MIPSKKTPLLKHDDAFKCELPGTALDSIQKGVMNYTYRNTLCHKSPFDLALYMLLLEKLKPKTIIEIGVKHGGSMLWFADMASIICPNPKIIGIDQSFESTTFDKRIQYLTGDSNNLSLILSAEILATLPKPWLIIEDSAHTFETCYSVLNFFRQKLSIGDYIIIEDGVLSHFTEPFYDQFEDGPIRAINQFLEENTDYQIDRELCDYYGKNATYNPGGYITKIA